MWFVTLIHQEVSQSCQRLKNWGLKLTGQRSQCGQTLKPLGAYYLVFMVPINWCRWGGGAWQAMGEDFPGFPLTDQNQSQHGSFQYHSPVCFTERNIHTTWGLETRSASCMKHWKNNALLFYSHSEWSQKLSQGSQGGQKDTHQHYSWCDSCNEH